jgi:hypothetical protein
MRSSKASSSAVKLDEGNGGLNYQKRACEWARSLVNQRRYDYEIAQVAALAQLVEHRIRNAGVVGSNPIGGTISPS